MAEKLNKTITGTSTEYTVEGNWDWIEVMAVDGVSAVYIAPAGVTAVTEADNMDVLPADLGATLYLDATGKAANTNLTNWLR